MKKQNKYSVLGMKALKRASAQVAEKARKNNQKIPVWKIDHIEYEVPEKIIEYTKGDGNSAQSAGCCNQN